MVYFYNAGFKGNLLKISLSLITGLLFTLSAYGQTTINLPSQCNCEVKKPSINISPGDTFPAGDEVGQLLVDVNGEVFIGMEIVGSQSLLSQALLMGFFCQEIH